MQQKHYHFKLNRYTTGTLVLLIIAVVSAVLVIQLNRTDAAPAVKPAIGAAVPSQFSFNGAIDWRQGPTNKTSMALFHNISDSCFTSAEHYLGTVDVGTELQKSQTSLMSQGYTVTPGSTQTLTIQTNTGPQKYELQQSSVTTPAGASKILGGNELGYLQLTNGYLKIYGNCETAEELSATIPALQAIKFDSTK